MSSSRIAIAFAAALVTGAAALVPAAQGAEATQDHSSGMHGFLSPQQRAMLMLENRGQWKSMSQDERRAAREKMRDTWLAMTPAERDTRRAALQAKWDALPQDQKDAINARIQQWAQRRSQNQP
jgi:hypothetical protein